ncbi:hypothetical protein FB567DRAFT_225337 [Paraphoma chrysanthemicola]|uniref:Uncharacterized protein n=1 Tax=Paraphoma chrysanthemicola TaxID=798071 RepID=A0A8K0VSS0_9PLEO|nr:hypothetical protein FB567DRAFT_225337 [Paraphoma chrysanthemicola]
MQPAPILVHHCNCTYNTPISYSPAVFSQNISCAHCGSISTGINVRGKPQEQANMQQDELTQLFSAHMNLSQDVNPHDLQQQQQQEQALQQQQTEAPKQIVYASQHYTHSHHVAPARSVSEPPVKTHIEPSDLEAVLLRNSIDPSLLFPSQVELFQNADDDQRLRLLELWRISPPSGRQGYPAGTDYNMSRQLYDWPPTSLAQEEAMAKLRYERLEAEKAQQEHITQHQQELDQSMAANSLSTSPTTQTAEPYMSSGYEMMARREYEQSAQTEKSLKETSRYNQATDPVYNAGLWQKNVGSVLDMENQYGAYAYAREYGMQSYADEEMVM